MTELRHSVTSCAHAAGLDGQRLDDFVLAVNELITNAVRHGGGQGWLRMWRHPGRLVCEVADHGRGSASAGSTIATAPRPTPPGAGASGWPAS